ncbi:MAG TPA: C1 family peptidase, partial [Bacteroidales bacterium]|nr:C1 family peptidase [Bacteroidales bacterium]
MKKLFISILALCLWFNSQAQDTGYHFKSVVDMEATTVKSQGSTGTCWCFATLSFLESELLRMGKPVYDLSEMYIVKKVYEEKAHLYIGNHGLSNFSQGGQAHDVFNEMIDHGMVPESVFPGIRYNSESHNHRELSTVLKNYLDGVLEARRPTTVWKEAFGAILDVYLGKVPETFQYNGKEYTPHTFYKELEINPDDYVEIMSYTNVPYYEKTPLLVPDNWSKDDYYNVPLDDFMKIMSNSLKQGYTFVWDGD